jgi:hypothetical protein
MASSLTDGLIKLQSQTQVLSGEGDGKEKEERKKFHHDCIGGCKLLFVLGGLLEMRQKNE